MHSIKHAPNDIARYGDTENLNVEGPEKSHKEWVKRQGGKTNQGSTSHRTMMVHSLRKEASNLLCEAVQGLYPLHILHILYISAYCAYFKTSEYPRCFLISFHQTARVDDDDPGYGSDAWTTTESRSGQARELRADRWHRTRPEEVIDGEDRSGIRCQIWERGKKRSHMTHRFAGGGGHNLGYDALPWESILHGDCGKYGQYKVISFLPDKIARDLFEFDSALYASHNLPEIPDDPSEISIHSLLQPVQVKYLYANAYCAYKTYFCIFTGKRSSGHAAAAGVRRGRGTPEDVLDPSHWTQNVCRRATCGLLALQRQDTTEIKSARPGVCAATRHR